MNLNDLNIHANAAVEDAVHNRQKLSSLVDLDLHIRPWLHGSALQPILVDVNPRIDGTFALIYRFRNEDLITFARIERAFWEHVGERMWTSDTVKEFLRYQSALPLASVQFHEDAWDLVVSPHPDMIGEDYPDHAFWKSAAVAERSAKENALSEIRYRRLEDVTRALSWETGRQLRFA